MSIRAPQEGFTRATRLNPCPVCGKTKHCSFNSSICICMRRSEGSIKDVIYGDGRVGYLHKTGVRQLFTSPRPLPEKEVPLAPIEVRDRVYREFLENLSLLPDHRSDLLRRGFTEETIAANGYKSVPVREFPWEICSRLKEKGLHLTGVPGFYKAANGRGGEYWTFSKKPGYFIPVRDARGRIQALQRRMDDPGEGKYLLFSSSNGTSGTPAHVAGPKELKSKRVWLTEGPLKADILAMYGVTAIAAIGATCWKPVLPALKELEAGEVVLAFDRDQDKNREVKAAVFKLRSTLIREGYKVYRAFWENGKGIDDAILYKSKVVIKLV